VVNLSRRDLLKLRSVFDTYGCCFNVHDLLILRQDQTYDIPGWQNIAWNIPPLFLAPLVGLTPMITDFARTKHMIFPVGKILPGTYLRYSWRRWDGVDAYDHRGYGFLRHSEQ